MSPWQQKEEREIEVAFAPKKNRGWGTPNIDWRQRRDARVVTLGNQVRVWSRGVLTLECTVLGDRPGFSPGRRGVRAGRPGAGSGRGGGATAARGCRGEPI